MTFWHGSLNHRKPFGVYSFLGRINHGLPQNSAMVFGEDEDDFVCILIATKDISRGEEIVLDYFGNLHSNEALDSDLLDGRRFRGQEIGFDADSMLPITIVLNSDQAPIEDKKRILREQLYSNGIIGKAAEQTYRAMDVGCFGLNDDECQRKKDMKKSIVSGHLFDVLRGRKKAESWTGDEFIKHFER